MADLHHPRFPRSNGYDPSWLVDLDMGPNPLWLLEDVLRELPPMPPGARVLDLGCGRGATSVFLARELGVRVDAVDLWLGADEVEPVLATAGVADAVTFTRADVRAGLPFEDDAFDAIVSIDAWEYFGTDDRLLPSLLRVLRPGGVLGVATPAMRTDVRDLGAIPDHIREGFGWEALTWHSPAWWRQQWELTGLVDDVRAWMQDGGWHDWLRWSRLAAPPGDPSVAVLEADGGELLGFAMITARKR